MKSSLLVSRIVRAVETDGGVGDGASLADAYAEAVRAVNRRLEGVQAALDAKQGSDAVRLLEDEPRLLDEAGTLDFFQLPEWQDLCSRSGWAVPERVDQALLERVLEVAGSAAMVEPALKMYRRAMRTHDEALTLQSLRSLAASDKSADWAKELRQAESAAQRRILEAFRKAKSAGDDAGMAQAAESLLDAKWSAPPEENLLREPLAFRREKDEARKKKEQAEDLDLLKKLSDDWKRERAESLLRHLDALALSGLPVPAEHEAAVVEVRARCEKEAAEAEAEARWRATVEQLHIAVAQGDPDEIRSVLASPEFLDRPPDEELQTRAEMAVAQAEDARRRKARLLVSCLVLVLLGVLLLAGKVYTQKQFDARCAAESSRLAQLAAAPRAHETLKNALEKLESEEPKVRRDPRIRTFETKLAEIETARNARLAEATGLFERLDAEQASDWPGDEEENRSTIEKLRGLLLPEDDELAKKLASCELSFQRTYSARHANSRTLAERELEPLVSDVEKATANCRTEFPSAVRLATVAECRKRADSWRTAYSDEAPALVPKLDAALAELDAAAKRMDEAAQATNELATAKDFESFLHARESLSSGFTDYRGVGTMGELSVSVDLFRRMMEGGLPGQRQHETDGGESAEAAWKEVKDVVDSFRGDNYWYSSYGVCDQKKVYAYYPGRPQISKEKTPIGTWNWKVQGNGLLNVINLQIENSITITLQSSETLDSKLTEVSSELRVAIDYFNNHYGDQEEFCRELYSRLKLLLKAAKGDSYPVESVDLGMERTRTGATRKFRPKSYLEQELSDSVFLKPGRFPAYARVQIMEQYIQWLETLGAFPESPPGPGNWRGRLADLAAIITIDEVENGLVWTCLADRRVLSRNKQCAEFLNKLPDDLFDQIQNARKFNEKLKEVSNWKAAFAGSFAFRPEKPDVLVPAILPEVAVDHPLYVLRKEGGNTLLRKALVPSRKNPGSWALAPGAKEIVKQGDPLFEVRRDGKASDPELDVAALLKNAPKGSERLFSKTSFWIELPEKKSEKPEAK